MIPKHVVEKFNGGLSRGDADACWPFVGGGHNRVGWHRTISSRDSSGKKHNYLAHRVAYELFTGPPGDLFVLHRCDNPVCCNPSHLFLGTQSDNCKDMWGKGRGRPGSPRGRKLGISQYRKVTQHNEQAVLEMYRKGFTQKQIASYFACSDVTIGNTLRRLGSTLLGRNGEASAIRRAAVNHEVVRLRSLGKTQYQVADELGISQAFVSKLEKEGRD